MNAFVNSVKDDLLDVRLRLAAILLAVALVAALAYAVLGGGGSSTPVPSGPAPVSPTAVGIAITPAVPTANQAVSETTHGAEKHGAGSSRDPFTPLPEAKTANGTSTAAASPAAASTAAASSATSKTSSSSSNPSTQTGSSTPSTPSSKGTGGSSTTPKSSKPATPKAPTSVYHVAVLFGVVPPGTPAQSVQLTPYENLETNTPLPSSKQPLLVFRGVTAGGKSAIFTVIGEVILHGQATCTPSASQCQAIELMQGQSEELELAPLGGQSVTYELQLVSISSTKTSVAHVATRADSEAKVARELLRGEGLLALPGLRDSSEPGVFVRTAHTTRLARRSPHGH